MILIDFLVLRPCFGSCALLYLLRQYLYFSFDFPSSFSNFNSSFAIFTPHLYASFTLFIIAIISLSLRLICNHFWIRIYLCPFLLSSSIFIYYQQQFNRTSRNWWISARRMTIRHDDRRFYNRTWKMWTCLHQLSFKTQKLFAVFLFLAKQCNDFTELCR